MSRCLAVLVAVLPSVAVADGDERFARLAERAEPLPSLSAFLAKYVGECDDALDRAGCLAQARAYRERVSGRRFRILVSEDEARMLSPGAFGEEGYSVKIAPFFTAGGYAVTHGAPRRTDASGNPMVSWIEAREEGSAEWTAAQFRRLFSTRSLRVEVVFTPNGVWSLPKRGGGRWYGVKARVEGLKVTVGRTGDRVALWLGRG